MASLTAVTTIPPAGAGAGGYPSVQEGDLAKLHPDCLELIFGILNGPDAHKMLHCLCPPKDKKRSGLDPDLIQAIKESCTHHDLSKVVMTKDDFMSYLKQFSNVQTLVIPENLRSEITDDDLKQIVKNCPNLTHLDLTDCWKITDDGLAHLTTKNADGSLKLRNLTHLILARCRRITNNGLDRLSDLTQLTHLDLAYCALISNSGLVHLTALNQLTYLNLTGLVTNDGLAHLTALTQLTHLDLTHCNDITDAGLAHLAAKNADGSLKLRNLTHLILAHCSSINDIGVAQLAVLTQLIHLSLYGCKVSYAENKVYETRQETIAVLSLIREKIYLED